MRSVKNRSHMQTVPKFELCSITKWVIELAGGIRRDRACFWEEVVSLFSIAPPPTYLPVWQRQCRRTSVLISPSLGMETRKLLEWQSSSWRIQNNMELFQKPLGHEVNSTTTYSRKKYFRNREFDRRHIRLWFNFWLVGNLTSAK